MDNIDSEPYFDPNRYELLFNQLVELDKDVHELIKLIALRGDGFKIQQQVFNNYADVIQMMDNIKALIFEVSKYEDTVQAYTLLEDIYLELLEIEKDKIEI